MDGVSVSSIILCSFAIRAGIVENHFKTDGYLFVVPAYGTGKPGIFPAPS